MLSIAIYVYLGIGLAGGKFIDSFAKNIDSRQNAKKEILLSSNKTNILEQIKLKKCGGYIDATEIKSGKISDNDYETLNESELFPLHCIWLIRSEAEDKIQLTVDELEFTGYPSCNESYLLIFKTEPKWLDSTKSFDVQPVKLCENNVNQTEKIGVIESTLRSLRIILHSKSSMVKYSLSYTVQKRIAKCNTATTDEEFEFQSPNYPEGLPNLSTLCELKVKHACEKKICQMRLDIIEFEMSPPIKGDCINDQFIVRANEPLPILCGHNDGQHLYVDVRGRKETSINFITTKLLPKPVGVYNESLINGQKYVKEWLLETFRDRKWKIKVTQIPCSCQENKIIHSNLAPAGCLQYTGGLSGYIKSFNYDGSIRNLEPCYNEVNPECGRHIHTGHLNNLEYSICLKTESGFCGVAYRATDQFQLNHKPVVNIDHSIQPKFGEKSCQDDFLTIPRGHHIQDVRMRYASDRYCGQIFGNRLVGPVISYAKPAWIAVHTDKREPNAGLARLDRGFILRYDQIPCSVNRADAAAFL